MKPILRNFLYIITGENWEQSTKTWRIGNEELRTETFQSISHGKKARA